MQFFTIYTCNFTPLGSVESSVRKLQMEITYPAQIIITKCINLNSPNSHTTQLNILANIFT